MKNGPWRLRLLVAGSMIITAILFLWIQQSPNDMTLRQKVLKAIYPALMWVTGIGKKSAVHEHRSSRLAPVSFYSLQAVSIQGEAIDWGSLRGKKVLLVNTASDCGYTAQYAALQELQDRFPERLVIIGFPANDFKQQEQGDNASIAAFCQRNYGVRFKLTQKTSVVPGGLQHPVYRWLTDPAQNGWNTKAPAWNFSKYLVDEEGRLTHYFEPSVSPLSDVVMGALQ